MAREERERLEELWVYIFAKKTFDNKKVPDKKEAFSKLLKDLERKDEN